MLLSEYQAYLAEVIDRFVRTDLLSHPNLMLMPEHLKLALLREPSLLWTAPDFFNVYVDARYR